MRQYDAQNLVVHLGNGRDPDVVVEVTPAQAGWEYIHFQVRRLPAQGTWRWETGDHELALVLLQGDVGVVSDRGEWPSIGTRRDVFSKPPSTLYLPRHTTFTVHANSNSEFAVAWAAADQDWEPRLVGPGDVELEIRRGDNATRHINRIMPPGFPIDAVVVARHNDVMLIPEGYHPVTSAPGYTTYYLNVLAGSAQSLAATDDPRYAWVKETYHLRDPRVPIHPMKRNA